MYYTCITNITIRITKHPRWPVHTFLKFRHHRNACEIHGTGITVKKSTRDVVKESPSISWSYLPFLNYEPQFLVPQVGSCRNLKCKNRIACLAIRTLDFSTIQYVAYIICTALICWFTGV